MRIMLLLPGRSNTQAATPSSSADVLLPWREKDKNGRGQTPIECSIDGRTDRQGEETNGRTDRYGGTHTHTHTCVPGETLVAVSYTHLTLPTTPYV